MHIDSLSGQFGAQANPAAVQVAWRPASRGWAFWHADLGLRIDLKWVTDCLERESKGVSRQVRGVVEIEAIGFRSGEHVHSSNVSAMKCLSKPGGFFRRSRPLALPVQSASPSASHFSSHSLKCQLITSWTHVCGSMETNGRQKRTLL